MAAAGLARRDPAHHPHPGARSHGACQCAVAGVRGLESGHQRAAGGGRRTSTWNFWRAAPRTAARKSWSATTVPACRRTFAAEFSNRFSPPGRAATASGSRSSSPWSRRTRAAFPWPTAFAAPHSSSNYRQTPSNYRRREVHEQYERIGPGGRRRCRAARGIGRHAAGRRSVGAGRRRMPTGALQAVAERRDRVGDLGCADARPQRLSAAVLDQTAAAGSAGGADDRLRHGRPSRGGHARGGDRLHRQAIRRPGADRDGEASAGVAGRAE